MPELPGQYTLAYPIAERADPVSEVERARKLIQDSCKGYKISSVETTEDKIVYTGGADHAQFVSCSTRIPYHDRSGLDHLQSSPGEGAGGPDDNGLREERQDVGKRLILRCEALSC